MRPVVALASFAAFRDPDFGELVGVTLREPHVEVAAVLELAADDSAAARQL